MKSRIVASLDITDRNSLIELWERIRKNVFAIKINWPTVLACGKSIISEMSKESRVICDFKIADIPNTDKLIMEQIRNEKPFAVIAQAFPGMDSIDSLIENAGEIKIIVVAAMSNPGASKYLNPNFPRIMEDIRERNIYGAVVGGNNIDILRETSRNKGNLKIFSPGIGVQGGSPVSAILNGSDYIIIGRSLYNSSNPEEYVDKINLEIENALATK